MASGIDAQVLLNANVNTTVFTTPATLKTYNIRIVNTTNSSITVGLAISTTTTPALNEWIVPTGRIIPAYGMIEETGIPISTVKNIVAIANSTGVNVAVWGI